MNNQLDADHSWLISAEAEPLLQFATAKIQGSHNLLKIVERLRKATSRERTALILQVAQVRLRALQKFRRAERMFLTRKGYEQATSENLANYKARELPPGGRLLDVCCGIGGDLVGLAQQREAVAIDRDPVHCAFAQKNLAVYERTSAQVLCGDALSVRWADFDWIHVDPDRRRHTRVTHALLVEPALPDILRKIGARLALIKLAPATKLSRPLRKLVHREWIGERRECKQQLIWISHPTRLSGRRSATVVQPDGTAARFVGMSRTRTTDDAPFRELGPYLIEPHAVILASRLVDSFAAEHSLHRLGPGMAYLIGNSPLQSPFGSCFRILAIESAEPKQLAKALRQANVGQVEWKKRGVETQALEAVRRIRTTGELAATVILAPWRGKIVSLICQRTIGTERLDGTRSHEHEP